MERILHLFRKWKAMGISAPFFEEDPAALTPALFTVQVRWGRFKFVWKLRVRNSAVPGAPSGHKLSSLTLTDSYFLFGDQHWLFIWVTWDSTRDRRHHLGCSLWRSSQVVKSFPIQRRDIQFCCPTWQCLSFSWMSVWFGSRRKNSAGNTLVFIAAAKQSCTEPRPFSAMSPSGRRHIPYHRTSSGRCSKRGWEFITFFHCLGALAGNWLWSGQQLLVRHLLYTYVYLS